MDAGNYMANQMSEQIENSEELHESKKCYVLMVSKKFPKTHPRAGYETGFPDKIGNVFFWGKETKIHTIRKNYELWQKRINEIQQGKAYLSIRYWSGKPYRSKQVEIMALNKAGIEKIEFSSGQFNCMLVNGQYCFTDLENSIAKNDGLSFEDFEAWFRGYDLTEPMAIIHFTEFRYAD